MRLSLPARSKGRPRTQTPEIRTTLIISDLHIPEMDMAAYNATLHFIRDKRPTYLFVAGDMLDLHSFSSFAKDPELDHRTEESLEMANDVLDALQEASPTTIIKFIAGNHEKRLTRTLYEIPEVLPFVTKGKKPDQLLVDALNLERRNIDYYGYPEVVNHHGFYITHGEAAGLHAAKKELETHGVSGVSGHCHANRYWERRGRNGVTQWWSIGGLCSRDVAYRPNNSWVGGIGYLSQIVGSDVFSFAALPIVKGQFLYDGKTYCQDGAFETV